MSTSTKLTLQERKNIANEASQKVFLNLKHAAGLNENDPPFLTVIDNIENSGFSIALAYGMQIEMDVTTYEACVEVATQLIKKGGVTLEENVDNALAFVLGHELMHILHEDAEYFFFEEHIDDELEHIISKALSQQKVDKDVVPQLKQEVLDHYTKKHESRADFFSLFLCHKAGYNLSIIANDLLNLMVESGSMARSSSKYCSLPVRKLHITKTADKLNTIERILDISSLTMACSNSDFSWKGFNFIEDYLTTPKLLNNYYINRIQNQFDPELFFNIGFALDYQHGSLAFSNENFQQSEGHEDFRRIRESKNEGPASLGQIESGLRLISHQHKNYSIALSNLIGLQYSNILKKGGDKKSEIRKMMASVLEFNAQNDAVEYRETALEDSLFELLKREGIDENILVKICNNTILTEKFSGKRSPTDVAENIVKKVLTDLPELVSNSLKIEKDTSGLYNIYTGVGFENTKFGEVIRWEKYIEEENYCSQSFTLVSIDEQQVSSIMEFELGSAMDAFTKEYNPPKWIWKIPNGKLLVYVRVDGNVSYGTTFCFQNNQLKGLYFFRESLEEEQSKLSRNEVEENQVEQNVTQIENTSDQTKIYI